ncbi:hypothetical protein H7I39_13880 [Mycobacterium doricum]|nr:hypothetical protein [Mycolicibacterium doricum]
MSGVRNEVVVESADRAADGRVTGKAHRPRALA